MFVDLNEFAPLTPRLVAPWTRRSVWDASKQKYCLPTRKARVFPKDGLWICDCPDASHPGRGLDPAEAFTDMLRFCSDEVKRDFLAATPI